MRNRYFSEVKLRLGGKPVIASVDELIDLIINGKTGMLVEPENRAMS